MIKVTMTQHPVGQGGMMSGLLEGFGKQLSWVYDCGSNQTDALNREINNVALHSTIDYLFLSHLDSDHISGVDRLLSRTKVKEVILPYLNEIDRLVALAHDIATETLTGEFQTFLTNIEGWFYERGVEHITYIEPLSDGQIGDQGPDIPSEPSNRENRITADWSTKGILISTRTKNSCPSVLQKTTACLQITIDSGFHWILAPYAHRPSDEVLNMFVKELRRKFNVRRITNKLLLSILKNENDLEKLRECYDLIWSDHNLISMALYAGPINAIESSCYCNNHSYWQKFRLNNLLYKNEFSMGWLSTGDMHLERSRRRNAFISHYRKLLDMVNVFVLPHHGSKLNFHSSLIKVIPNSEQYVAAAGPNSYGHPSKEVESAILVAGKEFIEVNDNVKSLLQWSHYF